MKAVCAWCGADLGEREGPADQTTHGVCPPCASNWRSVLPPADDEPMKEIDKMTTNRDVTGEINVSALLTRLDAKRDAGEALTFEDALELAEALRERLPDDLQVLGLDADDDQPATTELSELCGMVSTLWVGRVAQDPPTEVIARSSFDGEE